MGSSFQYSQREQGTPVKKSQWWVGAEASVSSSDCLRGKNIHVPETPWC